MICFRHLSGVPGSVALVILIIHLISGCAQQDRSPVIDSDYRHPLEPLNADEIFEVTRILSSGGKVNDHTRFGLIELAQPDKSEVLREKESALSERSGYAMLYDWSTRTAMEGIVHLSEKTIVSFDTLHTREPPVKYITMMRLREIVFSDSTFNRIMEDIGIEDIGRMGIVPDLLEEEKIPVVDGQQIVGARVYINGEKRQGDFGYGLTLQVNLTQGKIIKFDPLESYNATEGVSLFSADSSRPQLNPLSIIQSKGPGFLIDGSKITWQNWEIHFGINPRRALEIYDVSYFDGHEKRAVLYQAGASEMVTPYGDPNWISWFPIDEGNLNLAAYGIRPVEAGEDAPPNAILLDGVMHDHKGQPVIVPKAISVYERDGGLLWRHFNEARRARDLVLTSTVMIDNYDYVLSWVFHQNGTIDMEIILTGVINYYAADHMQNSADHPEVMYHNLVAPYVAGPLHQHFINFRLDLDVDGPENNIMEMNSYGRHETSGDLEDEWFYTKMEPLTTELQAKRSVSIVKSRCWMVTNPNRKTELGQVTAYELMPMGNAFPLPGRESVVRKKMRFLDAHLWVTPWRRGEMYPAGKYLNADFSGEGLPIWTKEDQSLVNRDLVLWYTVAVTHLPRPEDWPFMPSHRAGFSLMPFGFFNQNPTMDMPKPHPWN